MEQQKSFREIVKKYVNQSLTLAISASPASPAVGDVVTFTPAVWGDIISYSLSYGDGAVSAGAASRVTWNHIYTTPGTYTVKLSVIDSDGISYKTDQTIIINQCPTGQVQNENGVCVIPLLTCPNGQVLQNGVCVAVSSQLKQISAGGVHTCAINSSGQTYCWGLYDLLGGNTGNRVPVSVSALADKNIQQISAGSVHTCAIDSSGEVYCWGHNGDGVLGNGSTVNSLIPVATSALAGKNIQRIAAGEYNTCAIDSSGQVYCWGRNDYGQLGNGSHTDSSVPVAISALAGKTIRQIAVGSTLVCAIDSGGQAYCWGSNELGQFGDGSTVGSLVPVTVPTLAGKTIRQIAVGSTHVCVIDLNGQAYCWGRNNYGQLGNGSFTDSSIPVIVSALAGKNIQQIVTGDNYSCATDSSGQAYCWGRNNYGQLGNGSFTDSSVPVIVSAPAGKNTQQISASHSHTCTIDSGGQAYCWGWNLYDQLGGSSGSMAIPVAVTLPKP